MKDVSVIIPTYNSASLIRDAIESVLHQSVQVNEIIVVDDGSTDSTSEILRNYGSQIDCIYQENSGAAHARNRGIGEAKSDWLAFLDADDCWDRDHLEKMLLDESIDDEIGLVYCGKK